MRISSSRGEIKTTVGITVLAQLLSFWFFAVNSSFGVPPDSSSENSTPKLQLDTNSFDFGTVEEGVTVRHTFRITNAGSRVLHIENVSASCGCTMVVLTKNELEPGQTTTLKVSIDTAMKQGSVTKNVTIDSNDPLHPRLCVSLLINAINPHQGMSPEAGAKIFTDAHCASCHVAKGEGKVGRDLYNADCAMCHGPKAEGAVGPRLFGPYDDPKFANLMRTVLESGSKSHRSMPGFLKVNGGPLSEEQTQSLLDYLKSLSKARGI
jgi:mono/diheme cytochrome c family protein